MIIEKNLSDFSDMFPYIDKVIKSRLEKSLFISEVKLNSIRFLQILSAFLPSNNLTSDLNLITLSGILTLLSN